MIQANGALVCQMAQPDTHHVGLVRTRGGVTHVTGIRRCASVASCPCCAPVIRGQRAEEIDQGVAEALRRGHRVFFVTATIPHYSNDSLRASFDDVAGSWTAMWSGHRGTVNRKVLRWVGQVRSYEATWGEDNGWHPHVHALLFVSGDTQPRTVSAAMKACWKETVALRTGRIPHDVVGLDVSEVKKAPDVSKYLAKVEGGWGAGLEITRADVKLGKVGRLTPPQLLTLSMEGGEKWAVERWCEWDNVTYGRRMIQWSPGLKSTLGVGERSDEDLAADEVADEIVHSVWIPVGVWNLHVRCGREWEILEEFERDAERALSLATPHTGDPP